MKHMIVNGEAQVGGFFKTKEAAEKKLAFGQAHGVYLKCEVVEATPERIAAAKAWSKARRNPNWVG